MPNFKRNVLEGLPFTPIPDYFLAQIMADLSPSELKVMLYIYLHTTGYGKKADSISYDQFLNGITTRDGKQLDKGAGVSRRALVGALANLEEKGLITRTQTGFNTTVIRLRLPENSAVNNSTAESCVDITQKNKLFTMEQDRGKKEATQEAEVQFLHNQGVQQMQTFPVEVQNLHPTKESSHEKHENHDHGDVLLPELALKKQSKPVVEQSEKQVEGILTFMISHISGLTFSNARRLVRIARSNGRDDSYIRQLVAHVTGNSKIHTPAAVLTSLIKANEDRSGRKRPQKPLPINFDKYRQFQSSESQFVTDCQDTYLASPVVRETPIELQSTSYTTDVAVADSNAEATSLVPSQPADSRLRFALQQREPGLANYLRDMSIETGASGDELVLRFIGKPSVDTFDWWLPDVQIYHPSVTCIRLC